MSTVPPGDDDYMDLEPSSPPPGDGLNVRAPWFDPNPATTQRVLQTATALLERMALMEPRGASQPDQQARKVSLPDFWPSSPAAWFENAEAEMVSKGVVGQQAMYRAVLKSIPACHLERARGVLSLATTSAQPYLDLKNRLVELLTPSTLERCESILWGAELGGRRPSELMDTMLAALPVTEPAGFLFKTIFLNRLPSDMRDHVAVQFQQLEAKQLAQFADAIWDARNSKKATVAAVSVPEAARAGEDSQLDTVAAAIQSFQAKKNGSGKARSRGRGNRGGRGGQGGGQQRDGSKKAGVFICYPHLTYGREAYNCSDPATCQWPSGNE
jgi:hypothetical protein